MKKSTILTCFSAIGVVGTAILAAKEAPKAAKLCEMEEKKKLHPTKYDYFKACWKCYIPAAAVGTATIVCIFGTNSFNQQQQATLASAYGLLNESYRRYKEKVKEVYGEEANKDILRKITVEQANGTPIYSYTFSGKQCLDFEENEEKHLFYLDIPCCKECKDIYFESTVSRVLQAEYHINRNFMLGGEVSLNELLEFLGLEPTKGGDTFGWSMDSGIEWIDFDHTKTVLDEDLECFIIEPVFNPEPDYADY